MLNCGCSEAVIYRRGTLLIPSGPSHDLAKKHLFVICTDPCSENKRLIVSISTKTNALCDPTCVILPHEHPFLARESFVFYRMAKVEANSVLMSGVTKGYFVPRQDMNAQTFLRIVNGICASPQTPRGIKRYAGCV